MSRIHGSPGGPRYYGKRQEPACDASTREVRVVQLSLVWCSDQGLDRALLRSSIYSSDGVEFRTREFNDLWRGRQRRQEVWIQDPVWRLAIRRRRPRPPEIIKSCSTDQLTLVMKASTSRAEAKLGATRQTSADRRASDVRVARVARVGERNGSQHPEERASGLFRTQLGIQSRRRTRPAPRTPCLWRRNLAGQVDPGTGSILQLKAAVAGSPSDKPVWSSP